MLFALAAVGLGAAIMRKVRRSREQAPAAEDGSPGVPPTETGAEPAPPAPLPVTFVPRPPPQPRPLVLDFTSRPQPGPAAFSTPVRNMLAPVHHVSSLDVEGEAKS